MTGTTIFCLCVAVAVFAASGAADRVHPTYPPWVVDGLRVSPAGRMKIAVSAGHARFGDRTVAVSAAEFELAPPETIAVRDEKLVLKTEKPGSWAHGTSLRQCTCFPNGVGTPLPHCLMPGSVRVKSGPGDAPAFQRGKDYLIDETWAKLGRVADGAIGEKQVVYVDYVYRLQRIDSVVVRWDGTVRLRQGASRKTCPEPPPVADGEQRLANIFIWYSTRQIVPGLIFPCGPPFPEPSDQERRRRQQFVARTLAKLRAGEDVTIVTWGDSVTVGGDAQPIDRMAFAYRFADELRHKYPQARIKLINAGIGGSSTSQRLAGLEKDVLSHHPDLVTIEYVNDCGLPVPTLEANWRKAISAIKAAGAEVIIITPHFTMPPWMGMTYENLWGLDRRPQVAAMRRLAEELGVGLADASRRWEHLAAEGIPYVTLLHNGINHPDNRGHELFVKELMTFF